MKIRFVLAAALAFGASAAAAQPANTFTQIRKIEMKGPAPAAVKPPAAIPTFGCDARSGAICHFRIFYPAGRDRNVVLPAGMKTPVPDVRAGQETYCVAVNKKPAHKCARKTINATYNS